MITIKTNIKEVIAKLQKIADAGEKIDYSEALIFGVNAAMGQMKVRIFTNGVDANGIPFGRYVGKRSRIGKLRIGGTIVTASTLRKLKLQQKALTRFQKNNPDLEITAYEKKRLKLGRQILKKDLELTGDLRRGIVVGKINNQKVVCHIPNEFILMIAMGQEEQIGRIRGTGTADIFEFGANEKEVANINISLAIKNIYDRLLSSK